MQLKKSWEAFVQEAGKPNPGILAVLNAYGNRATIHSMKLVFQWVSGKIEFERVYHLLNGPMEAWVDRALEEVEWLGKGIQMSLIQEPLAVEYCPCCNASTSRTVNTGLARKLTAKNWSIDSFCSIYINPTFPSFAILISLRNELLHEGHLHRCGKHLHYHCEEFDERLPVRSVAKVRPLATQIMRRVLKQWQPARVFIGTGDPDAPSLIHRFVLPACWEKGTPSPSASCRGPKPPKWAC